MLRTNRITLLNARLINLSDIFSYMEKFHSEGIELTDGRFLYDFDFWDDAAHFKPLIALTYCEAGNLEPRYDADKSTYGKPLCYAFIPYELHGCLTAIPGYYDISYELCLSSGRDIKSFMALKPVALRFIAPIVKASSP
ncbi:MAG: hypothetical protein NC489_24915 [Ruminococcus flavefaciens]|nr:hypothetical protein [Ruminococcus flavefaciens]